MAEVREVDIVMIQIDPEIQPRERLFQKPLQVLTQLLQEDGAAAVPPVVLFHDPNDVYWLADGHYRVTAAKEALSTGGPHILWAEVHEGTKRDAFFYAAGANKHGTQLTDEEKRRVVKRLLQDDEWQKMSDSAIARHVGVSNSFVSGIHRELDSQEASLHDAKIPLTRTRTAVRGGKKYTMEIGKIGRGKKSNAKTAPPTTTPDNPSVPQYTDDLASDLRASGIEEVDALAADPQVITPEDDEELNQAWLRASYAERRAFIEWVMKRSITELGLDTPSMATQAIGEMVVEMYRTTDAP